ncbi:MarR family winged helix-turn-helix transcriptional regulator [Jannaschia formosa]|uniref:MarR family winged helix-turn-helix transcriptional regulator n=1 Tax=Jannaschia formosa TaxID=2259592 RepID=UPI0014309BCD|nr:MarR family transcriptional regulator [Jannaschia formosa]
MADLAQRLAMSVSSLVDRFKLRADGPYAGLGLVEASMIARVASSETSVTQGEIAAALGLPKTTMTSAVKRLEAKGLMVRDRSETDGRARVLWLTDEGAELACQLREAQVRASAAMLATLAPGDRETLVRLLERVATSSEAEDRG